MQRKSGRRKESKQQDTEPEGREEAQLDRTARIGFDICCLINRRALEREGYQFDGDAPGGERMAARRPQPAKAPSRQ
jgi:hypothetical protein